MAHCLAAAAAGVRAGLVWETSGRDTMMGIDQMGGWCAVIIKRRMPDGRQAVVHIEAIFDDDPFGGRCTELMRQYGVSVCVVEQLPNVNDARRFANAEAHRGRVFLAGYSTDAKSDMLSWGDNLTISDRRTAVEDRSRYTVNLQQYKAMQASLFRIKEGHCLFPDPDRLEQDVIDKGERKRIPLLRDWVFMHFTKTALVVEQHPDTRKPIPKVVKVGLDPHFSYANMLCDVAWARNHGTSTFVMPDSQKPDVASPVAQRVAERMPGLPPWVLNMIDSAPVGTCGGCVAFSAGKCEARGLNVQPRDPECPIYEARGES